MAYKKYIKKDGKIFGPYYYESYRDESGNVKKKYVGTTNPNNEKNRLIDSKSDKQRMGKFFALGILIFFGFVIFLNYINSFDPLFIYQEDIDILIPTKISGLVIGETDEFVEQSIDKETISLEVVVPKKDGYGNDNKRLDFNLKGKNIRLYFDLVNYTQVIDNVEEIIVKENSTEEDNSSIGLVDSVSITAFVVSDFNNNTLESEDINNTLQVDENNVEESSQIGEIEINETINTTSELNLSEELNQTIDQEIIDNSFNEKLKKVREKVEELGEVEVEEVVEDALIEAEDFDIEVEEILEKEYKWGYDVKLTDLNFMAKIDVTSDESISIWDNETIRIGGSLLSFSDLVAEGYTIRIEKPSLEINITKEEINITQESNQTMNQTNQTTELNITETNQTTTSNQTINQTNQTTEEAFNESFVENIQEENETEQEIVDDSDIEESKNNLSSEQEEAIEESGVTGQTVWNLFRTVLGFSDISSIIGLSVIGGEVKPDLEYENKISVFI